MSNDIIIKKGMLIDGTGKSAFEADVLVIGDRIKNIGSFNEYEANQIIDAKGLVVAPGFIDCHFCKRQIYFPRQSLSLYSLLIHGIRYLSAAQQTLFN